MKSIRLSLLVYFLGLLMAALGVASFLVYRTALQTLHAKEEAARKLVEARYEQRRREENQRLDDALLVQAQALARQVQLRVDWNHLPRYRSLNLWAMMLTNIGPNAHLRAPLLALQGVDHGRLSYEMWRSTIADIKLMESGLLLPDDVPAGEYFQIDSNYRGRPLRSQSLGNLSLPSEYDFARDEVLHWEWDDVDLAPGKTVRRVRLKASNARQVSIRAGHFGRGGPPRGKPPRPQQIEAEWPILTIVVQCAADTRKRDVAVARLQGERDEEEAQLARETANALTVLQNRLLLITSVTFVATVLGSFWLVRLGLLPLHRLSEAVSQVSPRDFRLHLGAADLSVELQPIAQRLSGALDQLKRAFAREKQATADISHELRTPLAALMTTIDLALRKERSGEHYREMLQECRASAQQMNQIIERLLILARLDAGVDILRPQPVDAATLVQQCASVVRPLAEAQGLSLEVHNECAGQGGPTATRLSTDPDKLREVLNNLLHNAVQYNRPAGRIDVTVARQNGHLELAVADTGVGIQAEEKERIFERFYRSDPSRNGDGLNAGLGLAIVKEYVDLLGGSIAVDSVPGQGSTFRLRLPVR